MTWLRLIPGEDGQGEECVQPNSRLRVELETMQKRWDQKTIMRELRFRMICEEEIPDEESDKIKVEIEEVNVVRTKNVVPISYDSTAGSSR